MDKMNKHKTEENEIVSSEKKITRKQAIKKAGLLAASTATMMVMLNDEANGMGIIHGGPRKSGPITSPAY